MTIKKKKKFQSKKETEKKNIIIKKKFSVRKEINKIISLKRDKKNVKKRPKKDFFLKSAGFMLHNSFSYIVIIMV